MCGLLGALVIADSIDRHSYKSASETLDYNRLARAVVKAQKEAEEEVRREKQYKERLDSMTSEERESYFAERRSSFKNFSF